MFQTQVGQISFDNKIQNFIIVLPIMLFHCGKWDSPLPTTKRFGAFLLWGSFGSDISKCEAFFCTSFQNRSKSSSVRIFSSVVSVSAATLWPSAAETVLLCRVFDRLSTCYMVGPPRHIPKKNSEVSICVFTLIIHDFTSGSNLDSRIDSQRVWRTE